MTLPRVPRLQLGRGEKTNLVGVRLAYTILLFFHPTELKPVMEILSNFRLDKIIGYTEHMRFTLDEVLAYIEYIRFMQESRIYSEYAYIRRGCFFNSTLHARWYPILHPRSRR